MKILHCITSLDTGGAEMTLVRLVNKSKFKHLILTIKNSHNLKKFLSSEVEIISIMPFSLRKWVKLFNSIKQFNPNIIQGWMYHGDLIASILGIIYSKSIFWNIRHGKMSLRYSSKKTYILRLLLAIFSHVIPEKIISCSNYGALVHQKVGYSKKKMQVIHNGISIKIKSNKNYRELNKKKSIKIASIGRKSPQKNRRYFIKIIDTLSRITTVETFIIGRGVTNSPELKRIKKECFYNLVIKESVADIQKVFSKIDILLLTSKYGEGCPNIIIEAMKSGILVISTDVGDSKFILNNQRLIIPSNNANNAARKIFKLINSNDLDNIVNLCKERADKKFNEENMIKKYETAWKSI